jgi:DNA-binding transcriptional regulator YiaG
MLRAAELKDFDFSGYVGIPVVLKQVPGYRCSGCGLHTLDGTIINTLEQVLAIAITQKPYLLSAQEAKYLRKHLGLTQEKLAERLGIARETLANWETGADRISPQHDFILRTVLVASLGVGHTQAMNASTFPRVLKEAIGTLTSVRRESPTPGAFLDPNLVQSILQKLRPSGPRSAGRHSR